MATAAPFEVFDLHQHRHNPAVNNKAGRIRDARIYDLFPDDFPNNSFHTYIVDESDPAYPVGGHGHFRKVEAMIPVGGVVMFELIDPNGEETRLELSSEQKQALLVRPGTWHKVAVQPGAALVVIASTPYEGREDEFYDRPKKSF